MMRVQLRLNMLIFNNSDVLLVSMLPGQANSEKQHKVSAVAYID